MAGWKVIKLIFEFVFPADHIRKCHGNRRAKLMRWRIRTVKEMLLLVDRIT